MSAARSLATAARATAAAAGTGSTAVPALARGIAASSTRMATIAVQVDGEAQSPSALSVLPGTLGEVLARIALPGVSTTGESWVAHMATGAADSAPATKVAVWSPEHGIHLLPAAANLAVAAGAELTLRWSDFLGIEPTWLHARLANNPALTRDEVLAKYMKVAMM